MRIATWNINSIRARVETLADWLVRADIDVLALQEIKCKPEQFPHERFRALGYESCAVGFNQWNGVAFLSRHPITDVSIGFEGMPGFGPEPAKRHPLQEQGANGHPCEARALGVTVEGMRLWSLYVPNGRARTHEHFAYKLEWLRALHTYTHTLLREHPDLPLALMGDWNIAPCPEDVGDPDFFAPDATHVSAEEREIFASFEDCLEDVVRPFCPTGYTFWDYQRMKYQRDEGMRIDFILGSREFAAQVRNAQICADERAGTIADEKPSDHVPLVCETDRTLLTLFDDPDANSDDDLPMIFG